MKDNKQRNYFSLRTMFWKNHVLEMPPSHAKKRLKSAQQKPIFLMVKDIPKCYTLNCSHKCPDTFPHSYALLRRLLFDKNDFM